MAAVSPQPGHDTIAWTGDNDLVELLQYYMTFLSIIRGIN